MKAAASHFRSQGARLILFTAVVFFVLSLFAYDASLLPDYRAYEVIYNIGGANFALSQQDLGFVAFILLSKFAGLSYEEFRILLKAVSLVALLYAAAAASKFSRFTPNPSMRKAGLYGAALIILGTYVFLLEFLEVRIRAGLALSLMAASFTGWLTLSRPRAHYKLLLVALLAGASYSVHGLTAAVSGYLLFSPLIYQRILFRSATGLERPAGIQLSLFVIMIITSAFLLIMLRQSAMRGEHLSSPLNPARFVILSVIPIVLAWPIIARERVRKGLFAWVKQGGAWRTSRQDFDFGRHAVVWLSVGLCTYMPLAVSLALLQLLGLTGGAGEAIVRVFTLNSIVAFFAIAMWIRHYSWYWIILMTFNSAFFINTLLTPSSSG